MAFDVGLADDLFTCVVKDETTTDYQSSKHTTKCAPTTAVRNFYEEVATSAGYKNGTFLLSWQRPDGDADQLSPESTLKLAELGLSTARKNNFLLSQKDGCDPEKVESCWGDDGYSGSAVDEKGSQYEPIASSPTQHQDVVESGHASPEPPVTFVGLVNQAMTCYLNSLLQTLYMTPEFRNALYKWHFDGTREEEARSIPFQVQKLFANLQTSTKSAVETTEVTKSFGWTSSDAWQQHDVQELCRVMFDALEKKFKGTEQDNLIKQLYEGSLQDYVKCLECKHESARTDTYLDIPLVIKPFGSEKACGSVEEALESFVAPETLDGTNQYMCEKCNKKVDAHKGLKFLSFPYLLTLQLKRFDFDYTTMNRIKLNDKVTFPQKLDLSRFASGEGGHSVKGDEQEVHDAVAGGSSPSTASASTPPGLDHTGDCSRTHDIASSENPPEVEVASESSELKLKDADPEASVSDDSASSQTNNSPYVYELFSIMVHSGSAVGGHYYAYIRSFETGKWYSFNDTSVTPITDEDIVRTYGSGARSMYSYSSMYTSSANAYMLMYRQVNPERNTLPLAADSFPSHVNAIVNRVADDEAEEQRLQEIERSMWKTKVYYQDPVTAKYLDKQFAINENASLKEAVAEAHKLWKLDGVVPVERCRLVKFDHFYDIPEASFEGHDDVAVCKLISNSLAYCDLLLETRGEDEVFEVYRSTGNGCILKVLLVDVPTQTVTAQRPLRAELSWTIRELKEWLAGKFHCRAEKMRVLMDRYYSAPQLISDDTTTLKSLGFYCSNKIYVAPSVLGAADEVDADLPYGESQLQGILDSFLHTLTLVLTLPSEEDIAPYRDEQPEAASSTSAADGTEEGSDEKTEESSDEKRGESSRQVTMKVDKRLSIADTKQKIATLMRVEPESFKVMRVHSSGQEYEVTRLSETLSHYTDPTRLRLVMGRALRAGEYRVKIYLFQLNPSVEPPAEDSSTNGTKTNGSTGSGCTPPTHTSDFLCDTVVSKGTSISQLKLNILEESGNSLPASVPRDPAFIRIRKKSYKSPSTVLLDSMRFEEDIYIYANWEVYLQPLTEPEPMKRSLETAVFVRRWFPSSLSMGPWEEVILPDLDVDSLLKVISEMSSIPAGNISYVRARGTFPSDTSVLEMAEQDWNPKVRLLNQFPVHLSDDGGVIFYYNTEEKWLDITSEKRREIQKEESSRFSSSYSSRWSVKEKALKIYTSVDEEGTS